MTSLNNITSITSKRVFDNIRTLGCGVILLAVLILTSCHEKEIPNEALKNQGTTVSTKLKVVPHKNIKPPIAFPFDPPKPRRLAQPLKVEKEIRGGKVIENEFAFVLTDELHLTHNDINFPKTIPSLSTSARVGLPFKRKEIARQLRKDSKLMHFDKHGGHPNLSIASMYQDQEGSLWGCSRWGGFWKFDGTKYLYYSEKTGLADYSVVDMLLESDGDIWLGLSTALVRFDGDSFINYSVEGQLSKIKPTKIVEDLTGNIWVGSGEGLFVIDKKANTITSIKKENGLLKDEINALFCDKDGALWIAYNHLGISKINRKRIDSEYSYHISNYTANDTSQFHNIQCIVQTRLGDLLVGSDRNLILMRSEDSKQESNSIQSYSYLLDGYGELVTLDIDEDKNGNIYIGTNTKLFQLELGVDGRVEKYYNLEEENLESSIVSSLIVDDENYLWVAYLFHGMYRLDLNAHLNAKYPISNEIVDQETDRFGNVWFTTKEAKLYCLKNPTDLDNQYLLDYTNVFGTQEALGGNFTIDHEDNLWLSRTIAGNHATIVKMYIGENESSNEYFDYVINHEFGIHQIAEILVDKKGVIWFAENTLNLNDKNLKSTGGGVYRIDKNKIYQYRKDQGLIANDTYSLTQDSDGNYWFSSLFYGIVKYVPSHDGGVGIWTHYLDDNIQKGPSFLFPYQDDGIMVKALYTDIHIPQSIDTVDQKMHFWTVSRTKLDPFFIDYDQSIDNQMLTVDLHSVNVFEKIIDWESYKSSESTTDLEYPNTTVDSVTRWTDIPINLSLSHENNYIEFEYNTIEIDRPYRVTYRHFLDGFENTWGESNTNTSTSYPNLDHGSYVFKVQARMDDGVWGEVMEYPFTIRPPWWYTWQAYLLYFLLVMLLLSLIYNYLFSLNLAKAESIRIKEIDTLKTRLYANITHEFRTPLTIISGMTSQIKDDPGQWLDNGIEMISRNADRLLSLVNQMLDLSKLESGKIALRNEQGDIIVYLKYITESVRSLGERKKLQIHFYTDVNEVVMDFDYEKIQQIMTNLISNAVKFTPAEGNIYVYVRTVVRNVKDRSNSFLQIKVKDTGIGIPKDELFHIFDRFYQIDDSNTRTGEGSGIGLALIKELILLMNGEISADSQPGDGAEFKILLPITNNATNRDFLNPSSVVDAIYEETGEIVSNLSQLQSITKVESIQVEPLLDKPQILIIEDNQDVVAYIVSCLQNDFAIKIGNDGQEGIDIALESIPDLIISDVMMPIKDGFEVCKALKSDERTSHIPIIILTAKSDMDSKLEGLTIGADAYISKPFHKEELLIRISSLILNREKLQHYYLSKASNVTLEESAEESQVVSEKEDEFVDKVVEVLESNIDNVDFSVDKFSAELLMSNSQLFRKMNALIGMSPSAYIRHFRLTKAKAMLKYSEDPISKIALKVGFEDPSYFSRIFKKEVGVSPNEWRSK